MITSFREKLKCALEKFYYVEDEDERLRLAKLEAKGRLFSAEYLSDDQLEHVNTRSSEERIAAIKNWLRECEEEEQRQLNE